MQYTDKELKLLEKIENTRAKSGSAEHLLSMLKKVPSRDVGDIDK